MKKRNIDEELRRARKRLEAMSKDEWYAAIRNFERWIEKVKAWQQAHEERPPRRIDPLKK